MDEGRFYTVAEDFWRFCSDANEAKEFSQRLATLNWEEFPNHLATMRDQREQAYALMIKQQEEKYAAQGGGYCSNCKELFSFLWTSPMPAKWEGKYCSNCRHSIIKEINSRRSFDDYITVCNGCDNYFLLKDIIQDNRLPSHDRYADNCHLCHEKLVQKHTRFCCLCNTQFIAPSQNDDIEVCPEHRSSKVIREYHRVIAHNERARSLDQRAYLTLPQWLHTLDYFDWHCAYCLGTFKGIEHFMPLSIGGDTSADNCVPSCNHCNIRKSDKHPNDFARLFPADNLARIRAYLASVE